jgi:hypothetical protein
MFESSQLYLVALSESSIFFSFRLGGAVQKLSLVSAIVAPIETVMQTGTLLECQWEVCWNIQNSPVTLQGLSEAWQLEAQLHRI